MVEEHRHADPKCVTLIRVYEVYGKWFIDGVDDHDRTTKTCWSFPLREQAVAYVEEFRIHVGIAREMRVTIVP